MIEPDAVLSLSRERLRNEKKVALVRCQTYNIAFTFRRFPPSHDDLYISKSYKIKNNDF